MILSCCGRAGEAVPRVEKQLPFNCRSNVLKKMKRHTFFRTLSLAMCRNSAQAQSSVTLFGIVDLYTTQNNGPAGKIHYNQPIVGADYFLSKRTDLYVNAVYQKASGGVASIAGIAAPSSNDTQATLVNGIRQKF